MSYTQWGGAAMVILVIIAVLYFVAEAFNYEVEASTVLCVMLLTVIFSFGVAMIAGGIP